jgi:hypothetical protein
MMKNEIKRNIQPISSLFWNVRSLRLLIVLKRDSRVLPF